MNLDFVKIQTDVNSKGKLCIYPVFVVGKSTDLMTRGGDFYAIWDEESQLWSTDEQDCIDKIDILLAEAADQAHKDGHGKAEVHYMWNSKSGAIDEWHKYVQHQQREHFHQLDDKLIFANTVTTKRDYATKKLPYALEEGPTEAWDRLVSVLYSPEERHKLEWAIGAVVTGDSKKIQKFEVLYGAAGTGKSTVLNVIQMLFDGYWCVFDAKALGNGNSSFALEPFKMNPLVAIQHDGDLSRIEDNERLNSLVSHEKMVVNEKFKATYAMRFGSFLFMGTNRPVKITDAKSGLLRRLIDVTPTGDKLSLKEYNKLMKQIPLELGAIAYHCRDIYLENPNYYDNYVPMSMMRSSNDFYNFMLDSYYVFKKENGTTLKQAWEMYKTYNDEAKVPFGLSYRPFKEELRNYFDSYDDRADVNGERMRSYYSGFRTDRFEKNDIPEPVPEEKYQLVFDCEQSIFDQTCAACPAQYASDKGTPMQKWSEVSTRLDDLDTTRLHYVKVPKNHIVIDFDIPDVNGEKSLEMNLAKASEWPPTYAELSKSGQGIHLHYIYSGDAEKLARLYEEHVEIKVYTGNSSLRRKLSKCNRLPIATLPSDFDMPEKEVKKTIDFEGFQNEKALRTKIAKNLRKEYVPGTKPSIDFIKKDLDEAYASGMHYDVSDLRQKIFVFASRSTHQSDYCMKLVGQMRFQSDDVGEAVMNEEHPIAFYDVEVFPNLFLVNWKVQGEGRPIVQMFNPKPNEIETLISNYRLIGFNCRRYDNHMLYACMIGRTPEQIFELSKRIVSHNDKNAMFGEAYNISYTDIYDFAAKKQSLKKWEIEMGIHHQELGLPWDEPVPEELWPKVADYCNNDVLATEALFDYLKGDWTARQCLAAITGMSPNDTTNTLTTRLVFGNEKKPKLVYTHLEEIFPGYFFGTWEDYYKQYPEYTLGVDEKEMASRMKDGKNRNLYRGVDLGFGGYVYAKPGMYGNLGLLDIASLHPSSAIALKYFGEYTQNFADLKQMRVYIKHKEYDKARQLFGGKLAKYLEDESTASALAQALKIAINSVYGLTSASFDNPFRHPENKNNIVALCGALFMKTLQDEVAKRGYLVAHIKTDSIKIVDADKEIIQFCMDFANKYHYDFEHEATYDRMCLVNDAVYIAKYKTEDGCRQLYGEDFDIPGDCKKHGGQWTATGTQFQIPYVFKSLFSKEDIIFEDLCETKSVSTALYLDMNENLIDGAEHDYHFVGKVGQFCPMVPGAGGGELVREGVDADGNKKFASATGAKGYRWLESEYVRVNGLEGGIDRRYYEAQCEEAIHAISEYGDFEWFTSEDPYIPNLPPWRNSDGPWEDEQNYFNVR